MADSSTSLFSDLDTLVESDMDASAPTLMSLPLEMIEHILSFLLPDKDVLTLVKGWEMCRRPETPSDKTEDDGPEDGGPEDDSSEDDMYDLGGPLEVGFEDAMKRPPLADWRYDDEFRYDKEPVQTAILRVNRLLYEEGSRILYGRAMKVNIFTSFYCDYYAQRLSFYQIRDFPWAKMRKIIIVVHSVVSKTDIRFLRQALWLVCGFLASSKPFIKKLQVIYTGEWDQNKKVWADNEHTYENDPPWNESEDENLLFMLKPLRLLTMVRECEIQLPPSVQDNQALAEVVQRYIRGIKDEEPFSAEELLIDREGFRDERSYLQESAEQDRRLEEIDEQEAREWREEREERDARLRERERREEIKRTQESLNASRSVQTRTDGEEHRETSYRNGPSKKRKDKRKGRRKGRGTGRK